MKRNTYIQGLGYRLKENCVVQEGSDEFDILISSSEQPCDVTQWEKLIYFNLDFFHIF